MEHKCHKCGANVSLSLNKQIGFKEYCDSCSSDLHCCLNCSFHEVNAYNQCREPSADRVVDKEKANYCDFFSFGSNKSNQSDKATEARKKLDDLFK